MKKIILSILATMLFFAPVVAENLRLEDLTRGVYSSRGIYGVHPLNDGERYSQISADGRQIIARSFRTGDRPTCSSMWPTPRATNASTISAATS